MAAGLEKIDFLSGWDFNMILRQSLIGLEIVVGVLAVGLALWFFIIKPAKFRDHVEVTDLETHQKYTDKGYLKRNRDGTQEYRLLKNKHARLPEPPGSNFVTKKGKKIRQLVKYGPGDYNWATSTEQWNEAKKEIKKFQITNVTDQNWNKYKIKTEAEKKTRENPLLKYAAPITIIVGLVIIMVMMWWIVGVAKEAIATGGSVLARANEISLQLTGCAGGGGAGGYTPPVDSGTPPPGM